MARKKNPWIKYLLILGVAVILLIVSMLKNRRYQQESKPIFDLKKEDITALTILSDQDTVSIRQLNDTTWTPVEPDTGDIDESKVDRLISGLMEMEQTGIATQKPEKHETYNVGDNSTRVDLKKGESILKSFYLGRSKSSWSQGYLRFEGEDKVYRTTKNLSYLANPDPGYWQK
jgi:hypothetical protein